MQPSEAFQQQLKATYAAIVDETFDRARHCLGLARVAQQAGDCAQVRKWMWSVRVLRLAASEWRKKAQQFLLRKDFPNRKCWFFCCDEVGAQASANLFSLAMTCRANDVDRFEYFSYIFEYAECPGLEAKDNATLSRLEHRASRSLGKIGGYEVLFRVEVVFTRLIDYSDLPEALGSGVRNGHVNFASL